MISQDTAAVRTHPYAAMAIGAFAVSASAILIDLSGTSPGTASVCRCVLALPLLTALSGRGHSDRLGLAVIAGILFAGDMLFWTQAIVEVGAGLSTVLVNTQVIIVPLLALLVDREPPGRRYLLWLPGLIIGTVLTGGVLEKGVAGADPIWGTIHAVLAAVCYSGFLFLLRRGGHHGNGVLFYRDVIAVAALASLVGGALWHGVTLTPGWAAVGWLALVALCGQVVGWLLVAVASPLLSSVAGSALLLITPAGALILAALILDEQPTALQLVGTVLMLVSAYGVSSTIRTDGRGQISRPALQPESRQLPLRPRRTRRRLPADEA